MDYNTLSILVIHRNIPSFQLDSAIVLAAVNHTFFPMSLQSTNQLAIRNFIGICTVTNQKYYLRIEYFSRHIHVSSSHQGQLRHKIYHILLFSSISLIRILGTMDFRIMCSHLGEVGVLPFQHGWMEQNLQKSGRKIFHRLYCFHHIYQKREFQVMLQSTFKF